MPSFRTFASYPEYTDYSNLNRHRARYHTMTDTWCTATRSDHPVRWADSIIGVVFIVCMVGGVVTNFISFLYFHKTSKASSGTANRIYFNRVYTMISLLNVTVGILNVPHVEAAFLPQRCGEKMLFNLSGFCKTWKGCWTLLAHTSMFMVAVLSVSRLILIISPNRNLQPILPFLLFMGCVVVVLMLIICVPVLMKGVTVQYVVEAMSCLPFDSSVISDCETDQDNTICDVSKSQDRMVVIISATIHGAPTIPIGFSCVLSLIYLRKTAKGAKRANASINRHVEASKTIAMVTLLYVICHVPEFMWFMYLLADSYLLPRTKMTKGEYVTLINGVSPVLGWYIWPAISLMGVNFYSALSPLVHFWRIKSFRRFFSRRNSVNILHRNEGEELQREHWSTYWIFVRKIK